MGLFKTEYSCNLCGSTSFKDMRARVNMKCAECGSLERTRALALKLEAAGLPRTGDRVLHFAPEKGLARYFIERVGEENYRACDLEPKRYSFLDVERFDLCRDSSSLPADTYHLIVHLHVMEHIPCNYTAVLHHLHRSLHPDGVHAMCIPFLGGSFDDCWGDLPDEEREFRFGQHDHVRRFGREDIQSTLGMLFDIPDTYDLESQFGCNALKRHRIPEYASKGFTPNTIFFVRKQGWKLTS
jgi:phosphoglycolate phosphatase